MQEQPQIAIVGCGGIGGVLACHLHREGVALHVVTTNAAVRSAWLGTGTTDGPSLDKKTIGPPLTPEWVHETMATLKAKIDIAFVAVQPLAIAQVASELEECLATDGLVVCLSNGLCEDHLARALGPERVVGAVVAWGARMPLPGKYLRTSKGGFLVGAFQENDRDLSHVVGLLGHVGPVRLTNNLRGARFSKLTINCAITALGTIGGTTLGRLLVHTEARRLALALMNESAEVAAAEGINLERVTKVDLAGLASRTTTSRGLTRVGQHALLLAIGARYRRLRSSMLSAMERGKKPAIDHINGEIVSRGQRLGVPTPFNRAATEVVWEIYEKRLAPGEEALREVRRRASESTAARLDASGETQARPLWPNP